MGVPSVQASGRCDNRSFECSGRLLVLPQTFTRRMETQSTSSSDDLAKVDLFSCKALTHCPLWFSCQVSSDLLGQDALAHTWPDLLLYAFSPALHRIFQRHYRMLLVAPNQSWRSWFLMLCRLLKGYPWSLPRRQDLLLLGTQFRHPTLDRLQRCVWLPRKSCDIKVQNTILNSRAPSTRNIYACRWKLFTYWSTPRGFVPEHPLALRYMWLQFLHCM